MANGQIGNNRVYIKGRIISGFRYSHEVYGERFFMADIGICRNSGYMDVIPLIIPERLAEAGHDYSGYVCIGGQIRSYNLREGGWRRLALFVFVQEVAFLGEEPEDNVNENRISLEGFLCKEPIYRRTPFGREIADVLLAVDRPYGKADYIPCVAWGWNAKFVARLKVGMAVGIQGRIQSREYVKWLSEGGAETRVAYEVSASTLQLKGSTGETPVGAMVCLGTQNDSGISS